MRILSIMAAVSLVPLVACTPTSTQAPARQAVVESKPVEPSAADVFFARLGQLCGKSYAGKLAVFNESDLEAFSGPAVMHVRDCSSNEIRIPFHVGENRSRTWIVTRTTDGLRLKHDHRHEDGSSDAQTMYGGDTSTAGTAERQEFPADSESKAMFDAGGIPASKDNVWGLEVDPGKQFAYELRRPNRHFRVEFDLTHEVATPPPAWGSEASAGD
jgi:hypothetical protein